MNNQVESIKIEVCRQSETILGVGLQGLYPWTPLGMLTVCSQTLAVFHGLLTMLMTLGIVATFILPPKFKSYFIYFLTF